MDLTDRLAADLDRGFPDLVREHQDGVYSGARRMTATPADAEDATQETFVRIYRALSGWDEGRIRALKVRPYVMATLTNVCRNKWRSASRRPEVPMVPRDDIDRSGPSDESRIDEADTWARLLAMLKERERTAVVLRHVVGLPFAEVAEALDIPVGTAKSDVHRAITKLRTQLTKERGVAV